jgi:hypothetical protein
MAAGSVVVTKTPLASGLFKISVAWTSSAGGAVSGNSFSVGAGALLQAKFVPGTAGTQPTDQYDVVVNDADSCDVVVGKGANLSNSAASLGVQNAPLSYLMGGTLDVVVANAGNAKTGTVILLIQGGRP